MPRAAADRPSRRLEAILGALRKHGVRAFRAKEIAGIGQGLEVEFGEVPTAQEPETTQVTPAKVGQLSPVRRNGTPPRDELDIVIEGRDEPLDADEVQ